MKTLILGGVRSGKTALAQRRAGASTLPVTYLATARPEDAEMQARIARHRADRPGHWISVEEPLHLAAALQTHCAADRCVIVDCLTLWLTNLLLHEDPEILTREREALLSVLPTLPGETIFVSNETGMGIVPLGELTRRYCDEAGWLHQRLAAHCGRVLLIVGGLPLTLKDTPT